ncbi:hypothetical protein ZIOFF_038813 [Zingiber officinale]|uniref:RRM domain-containing protein n=1 Tax=Zingiber officinale TaxID=94328 RepID=A0A8J5G5Y6_ZINOF|nr:hypothetical protein ZIOFF_038813 [Zingiber officinale]
MPPRSVKKAVAKRPSLRSKKNLAAIDESPSAEAEGVKREELKAEIIATPMSVEDPAADERAMTSEVDGATIVTEKPTQVLVEASQIQEVASEMVEEAASVEKAREQTVADDPEDAKEVDDSAVHPENAEVPKHPGDVAAVLEAEEEHDVVAADQDGYTNRNSDNVNEEENDEDDASLYIQTQMAVRKDKNFRIFIGGLDKGAVEEDIVNVFGMFGEIQSIRIAKYAVTQKSKGFAFIQYAKIDDARKVLSELKDGAEVKGKRVGVSASQDNNCLYLGNICKTWTKEQVTETLRGYGVEHLEDILLPEDPKKEGKTKGFAFLEFNSHSDAMEAFQRLRLPDAVFGCERSAKVAFAETSMNLSEEIMLQVKTVYIEDLPDSWDEKKIREICEHYGEIEKVQMFRKSATKKKDFAFVKFTSRESALACVEGMNSGQHGEGDVNVKVNLARPPKGRFAKRAAHGGFKVYKDDDVIEQVQSKRKKRSKSKQVSVQGDSKGKKKREESSFMSHGRSTKNRKQWQSNKGKKRSGGDGGIVVNERSSKKARKDYYHGNTHGRRSSIKRPYSKYSMPVINYQRYAYAGASGSNPYQSDLAPHAGYLPASQGHYSYGYEQRFSAYDIQRGSEFTGVIEFTDTYKLVIRIQAVEHIPGAVTMHHTTITEAPVIVYEGCRRPDETSVDEKNRAYTKLNLNDKCLPMMVRKLACSWFCCVVAA